MYDVPMSTVMTSLHNKSWFSLIPACTTDKNPNFILRCGTNRLPSLVTDSKHNKATHPKICSDHNLKPPSLEDERRPLSDNSKHLLAVLEVKRGIPRHTAAFCMDKHSSCGF